MTPQQASGIIEIRGWKNVVPPLATLETETFWRVRDLEGGIKASTPQAFLDSNMKLRTLLLLKGSLDDRLSLYNMAALGAQTSSGSGDDVAVESCGKEERQG